METSLGKGAHPSNPPLFRGKWSRAADRLLGEISGAPVLSILAVLSLSTASASDVGTAKQIGIGAEIGNGIIGVTGKYWFSPTVGVSAGLGDFGELLQFRADFEMDLFAVRDTDLGRFDLFWLAGLDSGLWFKPGVAIPRVGFGAGIGLDLKLHDEPIELFVHVGLAGFPVDYCVSSVTLFCHLQPRAGLGGRYYF